MNDVTKPKKKLWNRVKLSQKTAPYYFLAPIFLVFAVFMIYPIIYSFVLSFNTFEKGTYSFVGLQNYITVFKDPVFFKSLKNTMIYLVIQVPIMIMLSLVLGVLVEQKFLRCRSVFRLGIFLPAITALVAYSIIFKLLLNTDYGIINYLLGLIGIDNINWLGSTWPARFSIIAAITWRWTGYNMIIMIAGLSGISETLYEAADIDGASGLQKFTKVTLPMMKPMILYVAITSTIETLQLFDESFVLTMGGPDNATITTGHFLYNNGFVYFNFGYAAAISYILVIIMAVFSFVQFRIGREEK